MRSYIQILPLLATLGLAPAIGRADANATNTTPGYVMKVTMASHIVCDSPGNYHYESFFTCEHYLQYGESMAFIDSWESQDCFHYYSVADTTWIPDGASVSSLLSEFITNNNTFTSSQGPLMSWYGHDFGINDWATTYANSPTSKNADRVLWEATQRGIIDAKTTLRGPLTSTQATEINDYLTQGENVMNAQISMGVGVGVVVSRMHPLAGILISGGAAYSLPAPARDRVRAGDILVVTTGRVYLGPNSGIPVAQHIEIRIINRNLPFVNDTGKAIFVNDEGQIIWEVSSTVDDPEGKGVRLYMGSDGKIRFEVINP